MFFSVHIWTVIHNLYIQSLNFAKMARNTVDRSSIDVCCKVQTLNVRTTYFHPYLYTICTNMCVCMYFSLVFNVSLTMQSTCSHTACFIVSIKICVNTYSALLYIKYKVVPEPEERQESFLPSFPFFHLLLHWVKQPFLGIPPFISDPGSLCLFLFLYLDLL